MQMQDSKGRQNSQLIWDSLRDKRFQGDIPKVEGKDKYRVHGKGIDRPTRIYVRPDQLTAKIEKYARKGQRLERELEQ